jgi:hypothetical protein
LIKSSSLPSTLLQASISKIDLLAAWINPWHSLSVRGLLPFFMTLNIASSAASKFYFSNREAGVANLVD